MKLLWVTLTATLFCAAATSQDGVRFENRALEGAVRRALNEPHAPLMPDLLASAEFTTLNASGMGIQSLVGIEACTSLETIDLSLNQIEDITPLAALGAITTLYLHVNGISDLGPLARLEGLERLYLQKNRIANLAPLSRLRNLRELYLAMNAVESIAPLRDLAELRYLDLSENHLGDLTPLAGLRRLEQLLVYNNGIASVAPLASCVALHTIEMHDNNIVDVAPLASLASLRHLTLSNNRVRSVGALAALGNLELLALSGNRIDALDSWAGHVAWAEGTLVDLERNPLNETARCTTVPALLARGVAVRSTGGCGEDKDGDGLADAYEVAIGTRPDARDSDGDGLEDAAEILEHRTDPIRVDSDGDGLTDGFEVKYGFDPLASDGEGDEDRDGVSNLLEQEHGTNPRDAADRPRDAKLAVNVTEVTLREELPWAELTLANDGDLELRWLVRIGHRHVRVIRLGTTEMARMVQSRMPSRYWGLNEAGETVESGVGPDTVLIVGTSFERALKTEVVIENADNPADNVVISVELEPRPGALRARLTAVSLPPAGGTVFLDPSGGDYVAGTEVHLGAVPTDGWRFVEWQGAVVDAAAASTTITLEKDETVIAAFEPVRGGVFSCAPRYGLQQTAGTFDIGMLLAAALMLIRRPKSPSRGGTRG